MIAVSSMRVRTAHGNSFDHLLGAGEQGRWDIEPSARAVLPSSVPCAMITEGRPCETDGLP
jgi:hypothetical protein